MKKTKSKAAYTNIWLNRNKHLWKEVYYKKEINGGYSLIILKTISTPNIVSDRIKEINIKRKEKFEANNPEKYSISKRIQIKNKIRKKKTSINDV